MTLFKGKIMVTWVWFHSIVICLPHLFVSKLRFSTFYDSPRKVCEEAWNSKTDGRIFWTLYTILTVFGPLLLTVTAYILIWRTFRLSQKRICEGNNNASQTTKNELHLLKMMALMLVCYVIFWAPFIAAQFILHFKCSPPPLYLILTAAWFARLESVLDPILYGYLNKDFRNGLTSSLRSCPCSCLNGGHGQLPPAQQNHYSSEFSEPYQDVVIGVKYSSSKTIVQRQLDVKYSKAKGNSKIRNTLGDDAPELPFMGPQVTACVSESGIKIRPVLSEQPLSVKNLPPTHANEETNNDTKGDAPSFASIFPPFKKALPRQLPALEKRHGKKKKNVLKLRSRRIHSNYMPNSDEKNL
ncbi:unnamed protein product [Dimorphilus gyrociliatus]|uniref:G-protein coupled receptors family 1 profile domain-containing protein n=1 Tax=Dimorphilus gyrociliatus TaxID=2664684 RepID=A0A7I8W0S7_9ANNE|nr:unnamed protein product [Dimorphilus gyrociliatus]